MFCQYTVVVKYQTVCVLNISKLVSPLLTQMYMYVYLLLTYRQYFSYSRGDGVEEIINTKSGLDMSCTLNPF